MEIQDTANRALCIQKVFVEVILLAIGNTPNGRFHHIRTLLIYAPYYVYFPNEKAAQLGGLNALFIWL